MRFYSIIFTIFIFINPVFTEEIHFSGNLLNSLKKEKVQIVKSGTHENRIELIKNKFKGSELYLDFENSKASALKDKNDNYEIDRAIYQVGDGSIYSGKKFASFVAKDSYILVNASSNRLLRESVIKEPFYISLNIMPGESEQNSTIFTKTYITGGKKYGVECKIVNRKISLLLYNMFQLENGVTKTFELNSPTKLFSNTWTTIVVTINPVDGIGVLYENGKEKASFHAISGRNETTIPLFGFHRRDTGPLVIGRQYYGKLDDFLIGKGELLDVSRLSLPYQEVQLDETTQFISQPRGYALSKVVKTRYSKSFPVKLDYVSQVPEGTFLEVLYRFSEEPFEENSELPEWNHLGKNFHEKMSNIPFQYFQWKVILRSNHSGSKTPFLSSLTLKYKESNPPNPPFGIQVEADSVDHDNLRVCLKWNSSHEGEVKDGGGYLIHYGINPDRMIGTLAFNNEGLKFGNSKDSIRGSFIKECIDNSTIKLNLEKSKDRSFPYFRNGLTYYFKISAYNKNFPLTYYTDREGIGIDQKSKLSIPVLVNFRTNTDSSN